MKTEYSPLKAIHHPDQLNCLRTGEPTYPISFHIDICSACNMDCTFCAYRASDYTQAALFTSGAPVLPRGHNNPSRTITTHKLDQIIHSCLKMGTKAIEVTGGGEPTVHPDHRGQGIGKSLVNRCLFALLKIGISKCHLFVFGDNQGAIEFWKKVGWTQRVELMMMSQYLETEA